VQQSPPNIKDKNDSPAPRATAGHSFSERSTASMKKMEARVGIEPTIEDLQSSALPLGDRAILKMDFGKKKQDTQTRSSVFYQQTRSFFDFHCA